MGVPDKEDFREPLVPEQRVPSQRFVAVCDVLGFRSLSSSMSVGALATKYDLLVREGTRSYISVREYPTPNPGKAKHYRPGMTVFSDTMLLWSNIVDEHTAPSYESTFFNFIGAFFGLALRLGFPLRVGIAFGDCVIEPDRNLYIGGPIVDAYLAGESQDWVGVGCHRSCFKAPGAQNMILVDTILEYKVPLKPSGLGSEYIQHTIDWPFWSLGVAARGTDDDLGPLLSEKLVQHLGTRFEARWKRTLEYYRFRISVWNKRFSGKFSRTAYLKSRRRAIAALEGVIQPVSSTSTTPEKRSKRHRLKMSAETRQRLAEAKKAW